MTEILLEIGKKSIISLGALAILDFGWTYHTKARYFSLHGIWNIVITGLILPDLYKTIIDPLHAIAPGNEYNQWPIIMVMTLHLWHCMAYNGLTYDDYFHHILFVIGMCPTNFIWDWGYSTNFIIFFLCGLPGGLDYLMLAGVKHGYIHKISEKRINKYLNVWCRGPGCIAAACLVWINWMSGQTSHIPASVKIGIMLLAIFNGQYYSRRVVASWARHEYELSRSVETVYCTNCKHELRSKIQQS
jgi:hypothetical protein